MGNRPDHRNHSGTCGFNVFSRNFTDDTFLGLLGISYRNCYCGPAFRSTLDALREVGALCHVSDISRHCRDRSSFLPGLERTFLYHPADSCRSGCHSSLQGKGGRDRRKDQIKRVGNFLGHGRRVCIRLYGDGNLHICHLVIK